MDTTVNAIINCARCGEDHIGVGFSKFVRPVILDDGSSYGYWTMCPTENAPILMRITGSSESESFDDQIA